MELPTYLAVADALEATLVHEPAGTRVASEHELARVHSVSRLTARAALDELEQRHVVRRRKGSGTFVTRRYDYPVSTGPTPSWSEIVRTAGGEPRADVLDIAAAVEVPPAPVAGPLTRLTRMCWVNAERALHKTSWLTAAVVPGLAEALDGSDSLYAALDRAYGLRPVRRTLRAELVRPPEGVAEALDLRRNAEVIAVTTYTHSDRLQRTVEVTQAWLHTDVFRLVVDLGSHPV